MIAGIFVGGRSTRMGRTKALLRAPSGLTLVEHWVALTREIGATPVLVGRRADVPPIAEVIEDAAPDAGPLGGLVGLLERAGDSHALALACDMPHVDRVLLERLATAPAAIALAPRRGGQWEALFSRFDARLALPTARERLARHELALQALFDTLGARELTLSAAEEAMLDDWDRPEDVLRARPGRERP